MPAEQTVGIQYGGEGCLINGEFIVRTDPNAYNPKGGSNIFVIADSGLNVLFGELATYGVIRPDRRTRPVEVGAVGVSLDIFYSPTVRVGQRYIINFRGVSEKGILLDIETVGDELNFEPLNPKIDQKELLRRRLESNSVNSLEQ